MCGLIYTPLMGDLRTIQVAMLAYPGAQILDITGPLEMFAAANEIAANASSPEAKQYHTRILARETGPFETTSGMKLVADGSFLEDQGLIDMLMVSGGDGTREALGDQALIAFIRSNGAPNALFRFARALFFSPKPGC